MTTTNWYCVFDATEDDEMIERVAFAASNDAEARFVMPRFLALDARPLTQAVLCRRTTDNDEKGWEVL